MATITITVQSLLNAAHYDSFTVSDGITVGTLKTNIQTLNSTDPAWFDLYFLGILDPAQTLASLSIVNGTAIKINNKIGRLATLEARQKAKLNLAALQRAAVSNPRHTYDITELPTQYSGNTVVDNPNVGGLVTGRPWT